jgi:pimeloyl-ACP methyl ester carboxylesterase
MPSRKNVLSSSTPTIVLTHGALTDASVWAGVAGRLLDAGQRVIAPALPMRGLDSDAAYLDGVLSRVDGPVVLVAHSYAGAVISHPRAVRSADVRALVYVAAFQPDAGEAGGVLNEKFPGTLLTADNLVVTPNPLGGHDLSLRHDRFATVYAADVDPRVAEFMALSQRPIDPAALGETFDGQPTWRSIASWALVSTADRSLPPQILRFMADRAGSYTVEVEASHAVPVSRPDAVSDLVAKAVGNVSSSASAH